MIVTKVISGHCRLLKHKFTQIIYDAKGYQIGHCMHLVLPNHIVARFKYGGLKVVRHVSFMVRPSKPKMLLLLSYVHSTYSCFSTVLSEIYSLRQLCHSEDLPPQFSESLSFSHQDLFVTLSHKLGIPRVSITFYNL